VQFSHSLDEIGYERTSLRIGCARQVAFRFVDEYVNAFSVAQYGVDQLAANLDVIGFGIGLCSKLGHDLAVDRHLAGRDQFLRRTTRSDTGLGDKFLKSFLHR
jgi:hypothetical protein